MFWVTNTYDMCLWVNWMVDKNWITRRLGEKIEIVLDNYVIGFYDSIYYYYLIESCELRPFLLV
jgi:hypothetical protein